MSKSENAPRVIPPFCLMPEPASDVAASMFGGMMKRYPLAKGHRLGGQPQFIDQDETPRCAFGTPMSFYAQLDSLDEEYMLADRGMIYVFVCFNCFETKAVLQSN